MAFHNRLTRTQRILLAIFCFPLLPFYLCYICCCASGDEDEEDDPRSHDIKLDRMEKAAADTVDGHSNTGKRKAEESSANGNAEVGKTELLSVRPKNTVEALVQELLKGANTDIEKLRAIWMWVTHHIGFWPHGFTSCTTR
ncbi:hypothetical protein JZ751_014159 [Albula glossodonta]|uniref:Uncharacterized protein n=1 Tax=Albula glossodonta TaxID=121402 RepID=A0A8T2NVA1_9TELE|nr:hypothetical protein JZ751_014159 [Albula glossodonta]